MTVDLDGALYSPSFVQLKQGWLYLLVDPNSPNWISTNEPGSKILQMCDGRHALADIVNKWEGPLILKLEDSKNFLRQAAKVGFLSNQPDVSPEYPGRGEAIDCEKLEELWIHTNNSCNLHCKHCLVSSGDMPTIQLSTQEIMRLVDDALALGVRRLYFTGGEPFLRRDLLELIGYIIKRAELVILTNGTLLTEEKVARLKELGNGQLRLQVSLDGPDAETNDSLRGKGSFDLTVGGVKRLVASGLEPIITTTITKLNHRHVTDTTRFIASLGVSCHHILWLHARGRMKDNLASLQVSGERVAEVMGELREVSADVGVTVDNEESLKARVEAKRGRKNDLCHAGYSVLCVHCDGHVYPCAALSGEPGFDCGSVKEKPLEEIWLHSAVAREVRANSVQKRAGCNACFLKFFCGGGCFAQSYFDFQASHGWGCIMAAEPYCPAYKGQLMDIMWELARKGIHDVGEGPTLFNAMGTELRGCAHSSARVTNAAFEVATYHCACVLAVDGAEAGCRA